MTRRDNVEDDDNNNNNKKPRIESLEEKFLRFVEQGNVAGIEALFFNQIRSLEVRKRLVNLTRNGKTMLHIAAEKSLPSVVRWLLSDSGGRAAGFNRILDATEYTRKTALHIAIRKNHLETCKAIVEGCKVDNFEREKMLNTREKGGNILHIAVENKNIDVVQWILTEGRAAGFDGALKANVHGDTAFFIAVSNGDISLCRLLVAHERDRDSLVNALNKEEDTALHIAVANNDVEMITWLLSTDEDGGHFDNVREFSGRTSLHTVIRDGTFATFCAIIKGCSAKDGSRKALLNARDEADKTVLHTAAEYEEVKVIEWLLSDEGRAAGFDSLFAKNKNEENTALHVAVEEDSEEAFFAILVGASEENGERAELLNAENRYGWTVLHCATDRFNCRLITWLLSESGGRANGFNKVCSVDIDGRNALQNCLNSSTVETFIEGCNDEERAELFKVDSEGWTLLHWAIHEDSVGVIEWLLSESGGIAYEFERDNLFALTKKRENVLHIAAGVGGSYVEFFDLLLSYCRDTSERLRLFLGRDDKGWTIFHHAARWRRSELISHILRKYPEESKMIIDLRDDRGMTALHRTIIKGIDEESRKEWNDSQRDVVSAVAALLGLKGGDNDVKAVVTADPNVGLKFE